MPKLEYIRLDEIRQNPVAVRDVADRESQGFLDLVASIRSQGVLSPISLREKTDAADAYKYELVDGLQRFSASREVGTGTMDVTTDANGTQTFTGKYIDDGKGGKVGVIPAQIIERSEADTLIAQVIANAQRLETKPVEYAKGLMRYLGYNPAMTETELSFKIGKSTVWLAKTLRLNRLHDKIKGLVDAGNIPLVNAYSLADLPADEQLLWLDRAQTSPGPEFVGQVSQRRKQIRDANRKGETVGPVEFQATRHLRRLPDIKAEAEQASILPTMIRNLDLTKGLTKDASGLLEAANRGAKLALDWASTFDPDSQKQQKEKNDAREKQAADEKVKRDAERSEKKAQELAKKTQEARTLADAARAAATTVPA